MTSTTRLRKGELPPLTGIFTQCKICLETKDDALFKYQNGKRFGLVCRVCDLAKKRAEYATNDQVRELFKARSRDWGRNNKEAASVRAKNWKLKNIEKVKARRISYHLENAERINNKSRAWYLANTERAVESSKRKYADKYAYYRERAARYYANNKERLDAKNAEWRNKHKKEMLAYFRAYHLQRLKRVPVWADLARIKMIYKYCPKGYEVDHIIPLFGKTVCGLHVLNNLQYLTTSANCSKSNKFNSEDFPNG